MKIVLKKRPRYIILIIHLIYAAFTTFMGVALFLEPDMFMGTPICIWFVSSWFWDGLIWEIFGKEVIVFEEGVFKHRRSGRLYPRTTDIKLEYIDDVRLEKMPFSGKNSIGYFFGAKGGHVRIDYAILGNDEWPYSFYFGESVSDEQAKEIIQTINKQKDSYLDNIA